MLATLQMLGIEITWDPRIANFGPFELTWHGVFTAVGIAVGVFLAAWIGRRQGITEDDAYSVALVGVPCGIIGARAMFVLENRIRFEDQWLDVLRINEGGITVYGAIIGGVLGACIYGWIRKMPVLRGLDAAGFGILAGMAIGRIGDLINGEHIARVTGLPWGVAYSDPDSPGFSVGAGGLVYRHPATTYELIGDVLILGIMWLLFMRFWKHWPGITFFSGVILYSAMRFGVSYLRIDSCPTLESCPDYVVSNWMTFPQVVSIVTFAVGCLGLAYSIATGPRAAPDEVQTGAAAPPQRTPARAT